MTANAGALLNIAELESEDTARASSLVALLEQCFGEGMDGVPRSIWEAALLGPARDILSRPSKGFRARLVEAAWKLGRTERSDEQSERERRTSQMPAEIGALVEIIHAGSLVVDDVEDDSSERRGRATLHRLYGIPLAINTGNWMYFWPLELVGSLGLPEAVQTALRRQLGRAMFRCHFGQALDLGVHVGRIPQRWVTPVVRAAAELKTATLTELAATVGATAAGASPARVEAVGRFGRQLGTGLQMLDDLGNLSGGALQGASDEPPRNPKAWEDLRNGRPTWPWAFAADELAPTEFAALQMELRVISALTLAGRTPDVEPVAEALQRAVGMRGRHTAHRLLERALSDLEAAVGPSDEVDSLREMTAQLEVAYGVR